MGINKLPFPLSSHPVQPFCFICVLNHSEPELSGVMRALILKTQSMWWQACITVSSRDNSINVWQQQFTRLMVVFLEPARREDGEKQNVEDRLSQAYSDCFGIMTVVRWLAPVTPLGQMQRTLSQNPLSNTTVTSYCIILQGYRYMCSSLSRIGIVYIAKFHYTVVTKCFWISYLDMIVTIQLIVDG